MFDAYKHQFYRMSKAIVVTLMLLMAGQSTAALTNAAVISNAPEDIITGFTPTAMAYNGSRLFVASTGYSMESCGINPNQETPVLRSMNPDGSDVQVLLERCTFFQKGLVADETDLYFRDGDNILKRMAITGGPLNSLVADTCCGDLAHDATHLYWAQWGDAINEIWRINKSTNAKELVATVPDPAGHHIYGLAADETHLYWAGGNGAGGVIQRVAKAGGVVETLADSADGIINARAIAVDATDVYWTELEEGRVRRVAKTGGAVTDYADNQGSYMAESIVVNNTHLFWNDTTGGYDGRVRRAGKDGAATDDIALGELGPGNILLIDNYVYWGRYGAVRRLAIDAAPIAIDLAVEEVEVTQAVQSLSNDVPLVAEKRAIVRVYPRMVETHGELPGVMATARLRVFQNGVELTTTPLRPIKETVFVRPQAANRESLEESFNFIVPSQWRSGAFELRAEIEALSTVVTETILENNQQSVNVTFHPKLPLCVEMVSVRTAPNTAQAFAPGWNETLDWVEASYPIPHLIIDVGGTIEEAGGPYEMPGDDNKVMSRLTWYDFWHSHNAVNNCGGKAHFYGMIHPDKAVGGLGRRPGWQAWGTMATASTIGNTYPWYLPFSGEVMAHELGHNRGRKHVNCGNPDDFDLAYPWNYCDMGPTFDQSQWFGYHLIDDVVIHPAVAGDLMSYSHLLGKPQWISDYTYKALFNDLPSANVAAAAAMTTASQNALAVTAADEVIVLSAFLSPTLTSATFDSGYRIAKGLVSPEKLAKMTELVNANGAGPFHLQQLDGAGALLSDFAFDLTELEGELAGDIPVMLVVPYRDGAKTFVLLHQDQALVRRVVSRAAPEVTILTPNGGEMFETNFTITWKGDDADGDALRYTVQYSPNGGQTWDVVATDLPTPTLDVDDTFNLPGTLGEGLVRVIATDGVNATTDQSDAPFSLRPHTPHALISRPQHGEVFGLGEQITLSGRGYDAEDGMLIGERLVWQVDGVMVGSGREVVLDGLKLGVHTVTLWVLDAQQWSAKEEVTIHVRRQSCVPEHARLQVVFILDASPQMNPHHAAACQAITEAKEGFAAMGLEAEVAAFSTIGQFECADQNIQALDPATAVNHAADWGPAIASVVKAYPWQQAAVRLIVPMSNQGPADGNPLQDPGADRLAIDDAIGMANKAGIAISPVIIPQTFGPFQALLDLAAELAQSTGGHLIRWEAGAPLDLATALQEDQARLSCEPKVATVLPATATGRTQEVALTGSHLWPGATIYLGEKRLTALTFSPDGTVLRFPLPTELQDGEYTLRVAGAATGEVSLPGALTLKSETGTLDNPSGSTIFLPLIQQ